MELYSEAEAYKLYYGDMLDLDQVIKPNSIDSIITDPPYELNFMGKGWDKSGIAFDSESWRKCYEVLKPGGYLLAFGGSRTFYRIACAIEDAGFEIRDTIMWLYGSGFPKALNIGLAIDQKNGIESPIIIRQAQNEWAGWRTALKPSFEPIIMARKPCDGSCTDNVLKYGVGGLNIDECRIGDEVFFEMPIPWPTIEEQQKIGQFLEDVHSLVILYRQRLEKLKNIKAACLEGMFV